MSMRIVLVVRNGSILSFCMSIAAFAASVFVLLFEDTDLLLLTSSFHFRTRVLIGHVYLHKLIHLFAGLVCEVWVSSTGLGCEDKKTLDYVVVEFNKRTLGFAISTF